MNHTRSQGFTLIELMVTIVICGVLASLSYISYLALLKRQYESQLIIQLQGFDAANKIYKAKHGAYFLPPDATCGASTCSDDDILSNGIDPETSEPLLPDDPMVEALETIKDTLIQMGSEEFHHNYTTSLDGESYFLLIENGPGANSAGTDNMIVNDGFYAETVCCDETTDATCLTLEECQ